ncbi:MAG: chalcone isomerase family protein [Candidatus Delongbacteria bacterium]|nr:chalcone isomerase family protein [Candidatus Delongbacteria bacterium]
MKKYMLGFIIVVLFGMNSFVQAKQISGIEMPSKLKVDGAELILNGAGVREKFFLDLYVGGLYLTKKQSNPLTIINSKEDMAIRLHIVSGMITSKKMRNAVNEGFENSTNDNIIPIKKQIDEFIAVFKEEINKGDIFEMIYVDSLGTKILKNKKVSTTIKGLKFKKALFGIWLCDDPAQESLKEEMLGKD